MYMSNRFQVRLMLLGQGAHVENHCQVCTLILSSQDLKPMKVKHLTQGDITSNLQSGESSPLPALSRASSLFHGPSIFPSHLFALGTLPQDKLTHNKNKIPNT